MSLHYVFYYFWAGVITGVLFPSVPVLLTFGQRVAIGKAVDNFHMCFLVFLLSVFPLWSFSWRISKLFLFFIFFLLWHLLIDVARFWASWEWHTVSMCFGAVGIVRQPQQSSYICFLPSILKRRKSSQFASMFFICKVTSVISTSLRPSGP